MISHMDVFIQEKLQKSKLSYCIIDPVPQPRTQRGGTCGFSAIAFSARFYYLCNPNRYSALPARKRDIYPPAETSYRHIAKQYGITGNGGLWDTRLFQVFLDDYQVKINNFNTQKEMSDILISSLNLYQPVNLAVNMCVEKDGSKRLGANENGKNAHYITIVGYFYDEIGILYYIFNSWNTFMFDTEENVFSSTNTMRFRHPIREYKESGGIWTTMDDVQEEKIQKRIIQGEKIKVFSTQEIDLQYIRNQCIRIIPNNFDAEKHFSAVYKQRINQAQNSYEDYIKTSCSIQEDLDSRSLKSFAFGTMINNIPPLKRTGDVSTMQPREDTKKRKIFHSTTTLFFRFEKIGESEKIIRKSNYEIKRI